LLEIPLRGARLSVSLSTSFLLRLGAMVPMTIKKDMAKEALGAIATMRVSDDRVKKVTTQQLRQKFNLTKFNDNETIHDYALHLSGMAAHLAMLSEEVKDGEIVVKMLQSLLRSFKQIVIKTLLDVSTISTADLTGQLKEAEEAFKEAPTMLQQDVKLYLTEEEWDVWRKKGEAENHSGSGARGADTGKGRVHGWDHGRDGSSSGGSSSKPIGDECQLCGKMGH
jgi:hypothetical protein